MSLSNEEVLRLLDDYLHGLLTPELAAEVERHCETVPECHTAMDEARRRLSALKADPPVEASEQLIQTTVSRIQNTISRQRTLRRRVLFGTLGGIAAALLLMTGFHVYTVSVKASPLDLAVLGQRDLLAATMSSLRIRLTDRASNQPLANVLVTVELRRELKDVEVVQLASLKTDAHGGAEPRFQVPDWKNGVYEMRITAQAPAGTEVIKQNVQLKRSWQLMLTSDKPIYQPGQVIHVRALSLRRPDLKPVGEQPTVFTIADPKGNVISKQEGKTSKFGIASTDCALAAEILEGAYTIACKVGDTESRLQVQVEKYVLPKFKVALKMDKPFYQPGETARCTIQADYFFGKPVTSAPVDVQVFSEQNPGHALHTLKAKTDDKGTAVVEYRVPDRLLAQQPGAGQLPPGGMPRPPDVPALPPGVAPGAPAFIPPGGAADAPTPAALDVRLVFQAQVTDNAGQKHSGGISRVVTNQPTRIEVFPEGGTLVDGVSNKVYILVSRADGSPVQARLTVSGIRGEMRTDERGATSFDYTPSNKVARFTIRALNADNDFLAQRFVIFTCGESAYDFLVRTDKAVYKGGESMKLTALGHGSEPVFVDFIKDGKERVTLLSSTIDVSAGQGETTLDLPPDLSGTIEMCAYRMNENGVALRKSKVVYVSPAGELKIKTTFDQQDGEQPEYRPGAKAKLKMTLTDRDGKPTPGAISLAAVDEAVFAVLQERPGTERTFFTVEENLLKPVRALFPWTPAARPIPREGEQRQDRFEQALFAATTRTIITPQTDQAMNVRIKPAVVPVGPGGGDNTFPATAHTLTVDSYKDKVKQTEQLRQERKGWLFWGWVAVVAASLLAAYGSVWFFVDTSTMLKLHAGAALVLVPTFLLGFCVLFVLGSRSGAKFAADGAATVTMEKGMARDKDKDKMMKGDFPPMAAPAPGGAGIIDGDKAADPNQGVLEADNAPAARVRQHFPETLLWEPNLVTDNDGKLPELEVTLADSITTWRLSASAVAGDGRLGAAQLPLKVFQPFFVDLNLPVALTRNDEVAVPVVVYNYLDKPQTVTIKLADADWFTRQGDAELKVELQPGEVRSTSYRLKVTRVGNHELQVTASAQGVADALKKAIEVIPDGQKVETVHNGTLQDEADLFLQLPKNAIDGSARAVVKIYPSGFSQLVEGLDNIFRMPYGCFEQTSSTTYPNVLALDYLKRTGQTRPEIEKKARHFIHLGYQRLLTFETPGGGFGWFGNGGDARLTAYGLMEFSDMARVYDVDPALLQRTRQFLMSRRQQDGSWLSDFGHIPVGRPVNGGVLDTGMPNLAATAYVAWAVYGSGESPSSDASTTLQYMLLYQPREIKDPYILALVSNGLLAIDPTGKEAGPYLDQLDAIKTTSPDGKLVWWQQDVNARTMFYGAGISSQVETTALATMALVKGRRHTGTSRLALAWLVSKKDPNGTWYSTQATVLALRALVAGTAAPQVEKERRIVLRLGDKYEKEIRIPVSQADVMQQVDLSGLLVPGGQRLTLNETTGTAAGYQVTFRYHVPDDKPATEELLAVRLTYDRTEVAVGGEIRATAQVSNRMKQTAPMVMVDLPVPAGFVPLAEDLAALVGRKGGIARFQVTPRQVIVYLTELSADQPLQLSYRLRATMPVKIMAPGARVYEYYAPERQGRSPVTALTVTARP